MRSTVLCPAPAPRAPADLAYARTCYDHLAGEIAVAIHRQLLDAGRLVEDDGHLTINPSGYELLASMGVDVNAIRSSKRPKARPCLDWTQRRHHLAGAAGKELLIAFSANNWIRTGHHPRSVTITETGRLAIAHHFPLSAS
ncbi:MAG: hypothetical protein GY925_16785 [Actinomycetia bacterium]|nr:hypothetical protein [Actinomycetes bacterium]